VTRRTLVAVLFACFLAGTPAATAAPIGGLQHVQVGDITVGYREGGSGSGPPLVLIMGFAGAMYEWDPALLERLADGRRVIVFDNRGVATTSGPTAGMTIETMADDTAGLIEALGLGQVDVLGWSMGGYVAQELVLRHSELVNRLVLAATDPGSPRAVQPSAAVIALLESARRADLIEAIFPQTRAGRAAAKAYLARVGSSPACRRVTSRSARRRSGPSSGPSWPGTGPGPAATRRWGRSPSRRSSSTGRSTGSSPRPTRA
jgi:pimeloyl-ACP methyl ester carboxylesterase